MRVLLVGLAIIGLSTIAQAETLTIVIETRIKPEGIVGWEAGMKSRQTIIVDYSAATVTQTPVEIGKTDFGIGELEGIRSKFVISGQTFAGGEAHFDVKGQTASAAMIIPNIDYKFTFDLDQNNGTYKVKGCHDGFPSYTIKVGAYFAYDYEQSWNPLALLGSCDTSVDISGP